MEPMVLGSIPATKPVFFPSFFSLLVHSFFFYCNIFYKIKTAATCTHRLPLPHSSLIVYDYVTSAWVRAYCHLRNEMERNEVKICSLRNENL